MRKNNRALSVAAALMISALASSALAQTLPSQTEPKTKWSPAAELVVRAPWPPMWRLTKGESTVWVMVTLRRVPEGFGWDSTRVKKLLKGAKVLIVPQGGGGESPLKTDLPNGANIKDVLTADTYQRLQDTVAREGLPFERYSRYKPAYAGHFLAIDVHHQHMYRGQYYPDAMPVLAQSENVRIKRVDISVKSNYFDHLSALDKAGSEACLNTYLDGIDFNVKNVPKMAEAWGKSDLPALLGYYAAYPKDNCNAPNDQMVEERRSMTVNRLVNAIDDALSSPGRSVALVPLDWLLIEDGVLDRLSKKGVEIKSPES